jgi:hypothetical protein
MIAWLGPPPSDDPGYFDHLSIGSRLAELLDRIAGPGR